MKDYVKQKNRLKRTSVTKLITFKFFNIIFFFKKSYLLWVMICISIGTRWIDLMKIIQNQKKIQYQ